MIKVSDKVTFIDLKNIYETGRDYISKDYDFHELVKVVEAYSKIGKAYTLYDRFGDAIAIFGAFVYKEGRAGVWCVASKDIEMSKFSFYKEIKKKLDRFVEDHNVVKVESVARVDDPKAVKFLSCLGFSIEGRQALGAKDFVDTFYMGKVVGKNDKHK